MLPFQAPSRRFLREYGPSIDAAVRKHGVEASAAALARKVTKPSTKAPPHVARLLKNLASVYSEPELRHSYVEALRACASSRLDTRV